MYYFQLAGTGYIQLDFMPSWLFWNPTQKNILHHYTMVKYLRVTFSPRSGSALCHGSGTGLLKSSCHKISIQMSKHNFKTSMQLVLPTSLYLHLFVYTHESWTFFEHVFSPMYLVSLFLVQVPCIIFHIDIPSSIHHSMCGATLLFICYDQNLCYSWYYLLGDILVQSTKFLY